MLRMKDMISEFIYDYEMRKLTMKTKKYEAISSSQ